MADNILKESLSFKLKKAFTLIFIIAVLIGLDRFTKQLAIDYLKGEEPFVLLRGILELRYLENTGAAFGIFKGAAPMFFVIAIAVSAVLFILLLRMKITKRIMPLCACFLLIIAGGLGNLIDRAVYGYVVDFIYFSLIDFPIFNIADIYITCACFALVVLLTFFYKDDELKLL